MKPKTLLLLNLLLVLALGFATSPLSTQAAPLGGSITGSVTSPNGYPLPIGTVVKLFDPGNDSVRGQAQVNLNTGDFEFATLPNGLYLLKAVPPEASGLTQSQPLTITILNAPVDVGSLALTLPQITGSILAPDGITPHPADVTVFLPNGHPIQSIAAPTGAYAIGGLPAGEYNLQAYPRGSQPYFRTPFTPITLTDGVTQTLNLQLRAADLWGSVTDPIGVPVPAAKVIAASLNGTAQIAFTDFNGFWTLGALPQGSYLLTALPPQTAAGLNPAERVSVSLPTANNPYTLVLQSSDKFVTGTVTAQNGQIIQNAQIHARRVGHPGETQTLTNDAGEYSLNLTPGLWALTVRPITNTLPTDWVYRDGAQFVSFRDNDLPEEKTINFTVLLADSGATGNIQLPDASAPPFTVTVALYNNEGQGRVTQTLPNDGTFALNLPSGGYKIAIHPASDAYLAPALAPVQLPPNAPLDLGTITLQPRDALITGTITVSGTQMGIEGIPVVAMRPDAPGVVQTVSAPGGTYALAVSAGNWEIHPALLPTSPYLFTGEPAQITLAAGETVPDVNFTLSGTDAVLQGTLVDETGQPITPLEGWAAAAQIENPQIHNGAPIRDGIFTIYLPAGEYRLAAHLPAGSGYLSGADRSVQLLSGQTTAITLTVRTVDAHINGALTDPRANDQTVTGISGLVTAWSGYNWTAAPIQTGNGSFMLNVAAGLWRVNYAIQPGEYARVGTAQNVPVETGQTALIRLPVTRKDAQIQGIVLAPNGSPLAGALVLARGQSGLVEGLTLQTLSAADGTFSLPVPYGSYRLGATLPGTAWVKPAEQTFDVLQNGISGDHTLQFRQSDATLSGTLTVSNTVSGGMVHLFAWSNDGGYVNTTVPVTATEQTAQGAYQLGLISGQEWNIKAVYQHGSEYWQAQTTLRIDDSAQLLDLTLAGPNPLPRPVIIRFDAADTQQITLADGTEIYIPGSALPVQGTVTLSIVPIATLSNQHNAQTLPYGYAFLAYGPNGEPIEATFNQNVVIHFTYNEADLGGFPESYLRPAYFATTTNTWTLPESYAVDTAANRVTMEINHFTDFALTTNGKQFIFLPLLSR
ncbi:MAG: hypothetical protein OHK0052_24760 [Anaerolineales bacterium]